MLLYPRLSHCTDSTPHSAGTLFTKALLPLPSSYPLPPLSLPPFLPQFRTPTPTFAPRICLYCGAALLPPTRCPFLSPFHPPPALLLDRFLNHRLPPPRHSLSVPLTTHCAVHPFPLFPAAPPTSTPASPTQACAFTDSHPYGTGALSNQADAADVAEVLITGEARLAGLLGAVWPAVFFLQVQ
ncbi:unnamed protein product [Closterium sp. Naga37s-1]|nr:unnamed protein product [Closterium sp. Naga37s-1]